MVVVKRALQSTYARCAGSVTLKFSICSAIDVSRTALSIVTSAGNVSKPVRRYSLTSATLKLPHAICARKPFALRFYHYLHLVVGDISTADSILARPISPSFSEPIRTRHSVT